MSLPHLAQGCRGNFGLLTRRDVMENKQGLIMIAEEEKAFDSRARICELTFAMNSGRTRLQSGLLENCAWVRASSLC